MIENGFVSLGCEFDLSSFKNSENLIGNFYRQSNSFKPELLLEKSFTAESGQLKPQPDNFMYKSFNQEKVCFHRSYRNTAFVQSGRRLILQTALKYSIAKNKNIILI